MLEPPSAAFPELIRRQWDHKLENNPLPSWQKKAFVMYRICSHIFFFCSFLASHCTMVSLHKIVFELFPTSSPFMTLFTWVTLNGIPSPREDFVLDFLFCLKLLTSCLYIGMTVWQKYTSLWHLPVCLADIAPLWCGIKCGWNKVWDWLICSPFPYRYVFRLEYWKIL